MVEQAFTSVEYAERLDWIERPTKQKNENTGIQIQEKTLPNEAIKGVNSLRLMSR